MSAEQKYDSTARGWQRLLVRVGGSAIILAALLVVLPRDELWASLRALPAYAVPVGVAAYLTAHLLGVAKWRLLVNTAGAELSVRPAARAYYWGLFGNLFLPSVVGGDVVRAGMALRAARSRTGLLFGSLVDRVQDVIGLGVLAGVGALVSPRSLDEASARIFTMFVLLVAALGIVGLSALFLFPVRRLSFAIRRRLVVLRRAVRATAARPARLAAAFLLGLALQSGLIVLNWGLGRAIGIDATLAVWFFVWPLAKIAALLPLTQGGIGVREAALAALFAPFGVSAVAAVAAGLAFEAVVVTGGLLSGLVSLVLGRHRQPVAAMAALDVSRSTR